MGSDLTNSAININDTESINEWQSQFDNITQMPSREQVYGTNISKDYEVCLTMFDTQRERDYDLGRDYRFESLGLGECNVNVKYETMLGVKPGSIVYFDILMTETMNDIIAKYNKYAKANGKREIHYRMSA